jgi:hypothetical protein
MAGRARRLRAGAPSGRPRSTIRAATRTLRAVDDGPRTGGLEALLLIIGGVAAYVALSGGVWGAAPVAVVAFAALIWLERYARRRAREEEEARLRRLREGSIRHLDFEPDPFDRR